RRSLRRSGPPPRQGRRQGRQAVAKGIRIATGAGAARRQGADPSLSPQGAVGRNDRRAIFAGLCATTQAEDRNRSGASAIRADRNRNRLSAEGAGLARRSLVEPSAFAPISFVPKGEQSWHEDIRRRHPPRSSAR